MSQGQPSDGDVTALIYGCVERFGVFPACDDEIVAGREIAARLIGPLITSVSTLRAVHERNGAGVFVYRDGVAKGFLGVLLLRESGLRKIERDEFEAAEPDLDDVCQGGETPAAVYGWGFAATTVRASAAMVQALMAIRDEALPQAPFFCRAATPQGAKVVLGKMGYAPYPPSKTGMLVRWPDGAENVERAA